MFSALELKLVTGLAALAAVLVMFGLYTAHEREVGAAAIRAQAAEQALAGERASRIESDRRVVAIQGTAHAADQAASAARSDADAARSAGERLRLRLAAAEHSRSASNPATASSGAPEAQATGVPADLFWRVVESAGRYAAIADDAMIAGQACEAGYDGLTVKH